MTLLTIAAGTLLLGLLLANVAFLTWLFPDPTLPQDELQSESSSEASRDRSNP